MPKKPTHSESDVIACKVCLKEIPRDLAKSEEAKDYVHYFCGEACFVRWHDSAHGAGDEKPEKS